MSRNITGMIFLKTEHGRMIRSAMYNTSQIPPVIARGENESYNLEGATDYIKRQKALWESSDQFVGTNLVIEIQ